MPAAKAVAASAFPLVYTRQPRATQAVPGAPIRDAANWQHASDVGRINGGLAEADVVIDNLRGVIEVIHNCTNDPAVCVAQEARVSPDGKKIAYSVGYGNELVDVQYNGINLGIKEIPGLTHAQIWIYEPATRKKYAIPQPQGVIDRQPDWLDNDTLVFVSNRGNTYPFRSQGPMHEDPARCMNAPYCVTQEYGYGPEARSMHLWTMKIDGSEARNISPHEQWALAPAVMTNGDILYSCWNGHGNRSHDANSSIGASTVKNKWWLCRVDGNGADQTVILNAHKTSYLKTRDWLNGVVTGEHVSILRAVRSVAEIFRGKLAITNYYRANHLGSMGIIFGMDYGDPHVEGCSTASCYKDSYSPSGTPGSGRYVPSSFHAITPYGQDQDMDVRFEPRPPFRPLGKAGYPAPLPNTQTEFMVTHARGQCYEVTEPHQTQDQWLKGEPTCRKAIYRVKVPIVTDPFDTAQMEQIAGGPRWHAYDARAVAPYSTLFGQDAPRRPPPLDKNAACYLNVVDARKAELAPPAPYNWTQTLYEQCSTQGCAVNTENPEFYASKVRALTVLLPEMWDKSYTDDEEGYVARRNNIGHKSIAILGSQPLMADGSVRMQVPCETPLLMIGTDPRGLSLAHDEMLHSLRQGETRTCHGCHDGHSEERARELGAPAVERFKSTLAAATNPPMPVKQPPITFAQVRPILEKRCASCHQKLLSKWSYSAVAQDYEQIDGAFDTAAGPAPKQVSPRGDYLLARPYTSKYVAKFARDSLLHWKCMGARQDGRTDQQYNNDIDFGAAHVSGATPQECVTIGRWIDSGIQF
jgi:Hydrazine synthase alpha subunit middle domain